MSERDHNPELDPSRNQNRLPRREVSEKTARAVGQTAIEGTRNRDERTARQLGRMALRDRSDRDRQSSRPER